MDAYRGGPESRGAAKPRSGAHGMHHGGRIGGKRQSLPSLPAATQYTSKKKDLSSSKGQHKKKSRGDY